MTTTRSRILQLVAVLVFALSSPSCEGRPALAATDSARDTGSLGERINRAGRDGTEWLAYSVPVVAGARVGCCLSGGLKRGGGHDFRFTTCRLDREEGSFGNMEDSPAANALDLYLRVRGGEVDRILAVSSECPVEARGQTVRQLENVSPNESIALFTALARRTGGDIGEDDDVADRALMALAYHAGAPADAALRELATTGPGGKEPREDVRENAVFWIGQARGRAGFETLRDLLARERSAEQREKIVFSLSQTKEPEAPAVIRRVATDDASEDVRAQALFWLAQTGAPRAAEWILEAIARDASEEVREQGVFALSQLPDPIALASLTGLLRTSKDKEVRRQALFWLAQADDPKAMAELERILE